MANKLKQIRAGNEFFIQTHSTPIIPGMADVARSGCALLVLGKGLRMSGSGEDGCCGEFKPMASGDFLVIETEISSPREEVVEQLKVGDVLKVALHLTGDSPIVVLIYKGQVAGGIASPQARQIPQYIIQGTDYIATVLEKDNGQLRVRIKAIE